ncbi:MAG: hypothetical protein P4L87_20165, partial [Formivibrio sp.]|nr:hypothetical protein [Formivibrio sp.]
MSIKPAAPIPLKHQLPVAPAPAIIKTEDEPLSDEDDVKIISHFGPMAMAKAPQPRTTTTKQIETPSKRQVPLTAAAAAASSAPNKKPALMATMAAASSSVQPPPIQCTPKPYMKGSRGIRPSPDLDRVLWFISQAPLLGFQFMQPIKYDMSLINEYKTYTWEVKWDGNRALWDGHNKRLYSKSMRIYVKPPSEWANAMPANAYLDGELFYPKPDGTTFYQSDMAKVSSVWKAKSNDDIWKHLLFHIIDAVGEDACKQPHKWRSSLIRSVAGTPYIPLGDTRTLNLPYGPPCRYSPPNDFNPGQSIDAQIQQICARLKVEGAEGIIIKERDSPYKIGQQSKAWLKVKIYEDTEALMIGYATNRENETSAVVELADGSRHHIKSAM